jgi:hypothetical protein
MIWRADKRARTLIWRGISMAKIGRLRRRKARMERRRSWISRWEMLMAMIMILTRGRIRMKRKIMTKKGASNKTCNSILTERQTMTMNSKLRMMKRINRSRGILMEILINQRETKESLIVIWREEKSLIRIKWSYSKMGLNS